MKVCLLYSWWGATHHLDVVEMWTWKHMVAHLVDRCGFWLLRRKFWTMEFGQKMVFCGRPYVLEVSRLSCLGPEKEEKGHLNCALLPQQTESDAWLCGSTLHDIFPSRCCRDVHLSACSSKKRHRGQFEGVSYWVRISHCPWFFDQWLGWCVHVISSATEIPNLGVAVPPGLAVSFPSPCLKFYSLVTPLNVLPALL